MKKRKYENGKLLEECSRDYNGKINGWIEIRK